MATVQRIFRGREDPSRVTLANVFPASDLSFSTPFDEQSRYPRVVVESSNVRHIDALEPYLDRLVKTDIRERGFGTWTGLGEGDGGALLLFYSPLDRPSNRIRLLTTVLRSHLVGVCDLCLTSVAELDAVEDGRVVISAAVPLDTHLRNGSTFLPFFFC
jgi:hypothetical protein